MTEEAKAARREYQRQYRKDNKEKVLASKRDWEKRNRDKVNGYVRNWRRNHPDAVAAINERYWMKKAEQMKRDRESDMKE